MPTIEKLGRVRRSVQGFVTRRARALEPRRVHPFVGAKEAMDRPDGDNRAAAALCDHLPGCGLCAPADGEAAMISCELDLAPHPPTEVTYA